MLKPLKIVFGVVLLLSFVGPAFAQTVDTAWVRRYSGPGDHDDYAYAIAVDGFGNAYVTGQCSRTQYRDPDYVTIKYYSNGDTVWVKGYDGPEHTTDYAYGVAIDDSGNVYVIGTSAGSGTGSDYATIKYYPDGDTAWVRRYNSPENSNEEALAITLDGSNNVYVTGTSENTGASYDYATIKYYPNGDTAWARRYNDSNDVAVAIAVDDSGNVCVTGYSYGSGTGQDYATIKYNPNGDTAWVRRYNGPGDSTDWASAIAVDDSFNVYVTGRSYGSGTYYDYATIKYYPNGDTAWIRRYNGSGNSYDEALSMAIDDFGYVYVTGYSNDSVTSSNYATIKYYPNGDTAWVRRYNGPADSLDQAYAITLDSSGNVYVTGVSQSIGTGVDYVTIKYDSLGNEIWVERYDNNDDIPLDIAVNNLGNVYVTGASTGVGTGWDYATIKYVQKPSDVEDETEKSEKPSEFALSQNYPNPFNPSTTIQYTVRGLQFGVRSPLPTTLKIYNVLGEMARTLVNEEKLPGDYTVQWDGKNDKGKQLASGVYFYELRVGNNTSAKKMVMLK